MTPRYNKILMTVYRTRDKAEFKKKKNTKNGRTENINDRISLNTFLVRANGMRLPP